MPDDLDAIVKQYGGSVSSAPATSAPSDIDDIVKQYGGTIQGATQQPKPSTSKGLPAWEQALSAVQVPGIISPGSVPAAIEAGKGFLKGAARDAVNIATLGGRVKPAFGDPSTLPPEAKVNLAPSNPAQQVGASAEEAAAFALPAAGPAKVTRAVEALPTAARLLGKAVVEGVGAGLVAGAHTGDPAAMGKAALAAGGTSAVLGAAGAMLPSKATLARRLYQSALKPPPSMEEAERKAIINTGLREGITLDPNVVDKVQQRIAAVNDQISQQIKEKSTAGATVDPTTVAGYTKRSAARFANQVNPKDDLSAIQSAKQEFLDQNSRPAPYTKLQTSIEPGSEGQLVPAGEGVINYPQPIPLSKAQAMKQGTYRKLKDSYGEQASAAREAQKDLARGLKDEIVQAFPEIASLNARESSLLALESSLQRFVGREGNKQLIGLGTPMTATAAHAIGGPVIPLTMLKAALELPEVKSRLAIALARAAQNPGPGTALLRGTTQAAPKIAAYGVMPPPGQ